MLYLNQWQMTIRNELTVQFTSFERYLSIVSQKPLLKLEHTIYITESLFNFRVVDTYNI